jgi:methyl-accepting chemotaxis protein
MTEQENDLDLIDKLNEVSNKTSATVQGLANGLQRSAGTLAQTGTTIDENLGLLVSGFTTLRNMEKVSTGLITITTRLRKVGEGSAEAAEYAPKLQEQFEKLGLTLLDSNGEKLSSKKEVVFKCRISLLFCCF